MDIFSQYDSSVWPKATRESVRQIIEQAQAEAAKESPLAARRRDESWEQIIHWRVYARCGVVPVGYDFPLGQVWLTDACRQADDTLAVRLLDDGMDPDGAIHGRHAPRRYAKANRQDMPMTWAWLERKRLGEVANKQKHGRAEANARRAI